jgi:mono/diheme cytochrome c family protein
MKKILKIIAIGFISFYFLSCDRGNNHPGHIFFPDMAYSTAYETYSENPVFEEGVTMRLPAEGTVARENFPYPYEKTDQDRVIAANFLENPFDSNEDNLERGRKMYEVYCMICHGDKGDGMGSLYTSGKYNYPPASLLSEKMLSAPLGDFYHVITVGHGIMAEHGSMIQPADRWKISLYVKEILQD